MTYMQLHYLHAALFLTVKLLGSHTLNQTRSFLLAYQY